MGSLQSLSAAISDFQVGGQSSPQRRYPDDRKWFVAPRMAQKGSDSGSTPPTYFEETWGPVLEEARQKRAAVGKDRIKTKETRQGKDLLLVGGSDQQEALIHRHVQAMLELYSDPEFEESENPEAKHRLERKQGPAPRARNPQGSRNTIATPPSNIAAPRCGPRNTESPRRVS